MNSNSENGQSNSTVKNKTTNTGTENLDRKDTIDQTTTIQDTLSRSDNNNQTTTNTDTLTRNDTNDVTTTKESTLERTDNINTTNEKTENKTKDSTDTFKGSNVVDVTKSGMVAYTTYQEMIEKERNIWIFDFFKQIYKDVDNILTLKIYEV